MFIKKTDIKPHIYFAPSLLDFQLHFAVFISFKKKHVISLLRKVYHLTLKVFMRSKTESIAIFNFYLVKTKFSMFMASIRVLLSGLDNFSFCNSNDVLYCTVNGLFKWYVHPLDITNFPLNFLIVYAYSHFLLPGMQ